MSKKINILLVGYGKMGKMIHECVDYINGEVVAIYDPIDPEHNIPFEELDIRSVDVAIEFTDPKFGYYNVQKLLHRKVPVVTGTTGWFTRVIELEKQFHHKNHTLIYSANFSLGMNIFYDIIEESTKILDQSSLYDVYGLEAHHRVKTDAPSGTAKILSGIVTKNFTKKKKAIYGLQNIEVLNEEDFLFSVIRAGNIAGYHEIGFDSEFDEIKLIHNAKSRKGFAYGALLAAQHAVKVKGFYNFKDIFRKVISG